MPVYDNDMKTENYNIYSGCLVVNCTGKGKMHLYDLMNIKKKQVTHSGLTNSQVVQNRLSLVKRMLLDGQQATGLTLTFFEGLRQPSGDII